MRLRDAQPVDGAVCGDGVVGLEEECDSPNGGDAASGFCGKSGSAFACLRIPDSAGDCPVGLVSSNGRCLAGSGDFESPQTLVDGFAIVGTADFDGDGQTDLLYQSASGLSVTYFDEGAPVEPAFQFDAFFNGEVWPSVDVNGDAARDLLIPNSLRNGVGVFVGTEERSFDPVFQPSFAIDQASRLVALPPALEDGEYTFASRFLRQLGVFSVSENGTPILCVASADGDCMGMPLPGVTAGIMQSDLQKVLVMEPLFVVPPLGSPKFHLLYSLPVEPTSIPDVISIRFGGGILPDAVQVTLPLGMPATDPSLACVATCASGISETDCDCVPFDTVQLLGIQPLTIGEDDATSVILAGAQVESSLGRHVVVFGHDPLGANAFSPITSYAASLELGEGVATNVQLGNFDGLGLGDSVVSVKTPIGGDAFIDSNIIFMGEPSPSVQGGPIGVATVGDINGDGYDDILGNDPESFDGGSYVVFGGSTVPLVGAPLDAPGTTDRHVIADIDGNGVNDVIAIGSSRTPIGGSGMMGGEDVQSDQLESTLTVMFGQTADFPTAGLTFNTTKSFEQVLPLKLQLRSPGGETADGIDDLAILLRDQDGVASGSLVAGDPYGFLSSPFFLRNAVVSELGKEYVLATGYGLPEGVDLGDGRSAIAVLYVVDTETVDENTAIANGAFLTLSVDEAGELKLDRPSEDMGSFYPFVNIVVYESSPNVKFAVLGQLDDEFGVRRFELVDGVVVPIDWTKVTSTYPELVTGSMQGDGRIFLVEQEPYATDIGGVEGAIGIRDLDDPSVSIELTSPSGRSQWLGPSRLQVGRHVIDMSALGPGATASSVIDACVASDATLPIDFSFGTLAPADLNDDGLPDALIANPMSWAFQTTSESVCEL